MSVSSLYPFKSLFLRKKKEQKQDVAPPPQQPSQRRREEDTFALQAISTSSRGRLTVDAALGPSILAARQTEIRSERLQPGSSLPVKGYAFTKVEIPYTQKEGKALSERDRAEVLLEKASRVEVPVQLIPEAERSGRPSDVWSGLELVDFLENQERSVCLNVKLDENSEVNRLTLNQRRLTPKGNDNDPMDDVDTVQLQRYPGQSLESFIVQGLQNALNLSQDKITLEEAGRNPVENLSENSLHYGTDPQFMEKYTGEAFAEKKGKSHLAQEYAHADYFKRDVTPPDQYKQRENLNSLKNGELHPTGKTTDPQILAEMKVEFNRQWKMLNKYYVPPASDWSKGRKQSPELVDLAPGSLDGWVKAAHPVSEITEEPSPGFSFNIGEDRRLSRVSKGSPEIVEEPGPSHSQIASAMERFRAVSSPEIVEVQESPHSTFSPEMQSFRQQRDASHRHGEISEGARHEAEITEEHPPQPHLAPIPMKDLQEAAVEERLNTLGAALDAKAEEAQLKTLKKTSLPKWWNALMPQSKARHRALKETKERLEQVRLAAQQFEAKEKALEAQIAAHEVHPQYDPLSKKEVQRYEKLKAEIFAKKGQESFHSDMVTVAENVLDLEDALKSAKVRKEQARKAKARAEEAMDLNGTWEDPAANAEVARANKQQELAQAAAQAGAARLRLLDKLFLPELHKPLQAQREQRLNLKYIHGPSIGPHGSQAEAHLANDVHEYVFGKSGLQREITDEHENPVAVAHSEVKAAEDRLKTLKKVPLPKWWNALMPQSKARHMAIKETQAKLTQARIEAQKAEALARQTEDPASGVESPEFKLLTKSQRMKAWDRLERQEKGLDPSPQAIAQRRKAEREEFAREMPNHPWA